MIIRPSKRPKSNQVIYLDDDFNIVTKEKATIVKLYEDGNVLFLFPNSGENKSVTVKKNSQTPRKSVSGKKQTQLVGTTSAASRLAQKARWKKISEKSSAD